MTKKLLALLVAFVMVLIPLSALAKTARPELRTQPMPTRDQTTVYSFDFESDPEAAGWVFNDSDGDGFNWEWQGDYSVTPHMTAYEGEGLIYSYSYDNDTETPLTPDNWVRTPAVAIPAADYAYVSFYVAGQDSSYADEVYKVYVTVNGQDIAVSEDLVSTGSYKQKAIDVSAYAGQTVAFAIRHYNITDMFALDVDSFEVFTSTEEYEEPVDPPHPLPEGCIMGYYFENDYEFEHIYLLDNDGDGDYWGVGSSANGFPIYEGDHVAVSFSYDQGALTPDNWIIFETPEVPSTGLTVTFYAKGYSSWAAEHFACYAITEADLEDENFPNNMTPVYPETVTTNAWTMYTVDLSAFYGEEILFAIRHFNCTDEYFLSVDQVEFWGTPDDNPPAPVTHDLVIEYIYEDGTTAAPTYTQAYEEGAAYDVASPEIAGYTPSTASVTGTMGTSDVYVRVVYTADEPAGLLGDVDCDGDVDFDDVTLLNAYLLNAATLSEQGLANANVNGDSKVSSADVVALNKLILGSN